MRKNKWWLNGGRGSGRTFRLLWETYENKIADLEWYSTSLWWIVIKLSIRSKEEYEYTICLVVSLWLS